MVHTFSHRIVVFVVVVQFFCSSFSRPFSNSVIVQVCRYLKSCFSNLSLCCYSAIVQSGGVHTSSPPSPPVLGLSRGGVVVAVVDLAPQVLLLLLQLGHLTVQVGHHLVVVLVIPLVAGVAVAPARPHPGEHVGDELGERHTEDGAGRQGGQEPGDGARDEIESEARPGIEKSGHSVYWFSEVLILQQGSQPFH